MSTRINSGPPVHPLASFKRTQKKQQEREWTAVLSFRNRNRPQIFVNPGISPESIDRCKPALAARRASPRHPLPVTLPPSRIPNTAQPNTPTREINEPLHGAKRAHSMENYSYRLSIHSVTPMLPQVFSCHHAQKKEPPLQQLVEQVTINKMLTAAQNAHPFPTTHSAVGATLFGAQDLQRLRGCSPEV